MLNPQDHIREGHIPQDCNIEPPRCWTLLTRDVSLMVIGVDVDGEGSLFSPFSSGVENDRECSLVVTAFLSVNT